MNQTVGTEILLSHSRAVAMSGGAKKSSATMSCICPADCCSPEEVEKEENYVWLLIKVSFHLFFIFINFIHTTISPFSSMMSLFKVLYGQWIVMGSLALLIIARQPKKHLISLKLKLKD